ncbi:MAG: protein BatD [Alphaproteobacteria bacterium]|nr:protein BatD [Alphaproteobacteria bacterium]
MKNRMLFLFLVMFALCRNAVAFEASVSRTVIPEGESFQLYLRQDGNGAKPDISVLNKDFLITMERKSYKSSYVNGKTQTFNENILTLVPKKTGKVILPSIQAGKEKTAPITLTVIAGGQALPDDPVARQKAQTAQPNVFVRYTLENKDPYVGQQIPLTVRLYSFVQTPLLDGTVLPPKADGVTVEQWGDVNRFREKIHGRTYDVLEYQFLLFAQKSGKLELSPAQFRGSVSDPDTKMQEIEDLFGMGGTGIFSGFFGQKNIVVQSEPIVLNVRPAASVAGNYWLPATDVAVSEDLTPPKQTIALGEALTRTVTVMASGVQDSQIPDLVFANGEKYKQYPGKTDSKNLFDDEGIVGVKTRQIVFMPTVAGNIDLPPLEISWFDVKTGKMKKAVLPSRTITVTGDDTPESSVAEPPSVQTTAMSPQDQQEPVKKESEFAKAFSEPPENTAEQQAAQAFWKKHAAQSPFILFVAGIVAGGTVVLSLWLLFYFLMLKKKDAVSLSEQKKKNDSAAVQRLKEACRSGSAEGAKQALLDWGRIHWPDNSPLTLSELASRLNSEALKEETDSLNRALYAVKPDEWNGEDLWLAFKFARPDEKKNAEDEKIPVPPLYPN